MKEVPEMKKKKKNNIPILHEDVLEAGKKAGKKVGKVAGEFKEFISRGNVTDMAVGVIVGTSFTAIVNSLANDVITPLLGLLIGGIDLTKLSVTINSFVFPDFSVKIAYGEFLQAVFRFFIIAVCVFFMVKTLNAIRRKKDTSEEENKPDAQTLLLTEIRDLLKNRSDSDKSPDNVQEEPTRDSSPSESKSSD